VQDSTGFRPLSDGTALRARERNVDFNTKFYKLSCLVGSPRCAVSGLYDVKYPHF
jgi:hypothetical protein